MNAQLFKRGLPPIRRVGGGETTMHGLARIDAMRITLAALGLLVLACPVTGQEPEADRSITPWRFCADPAASHWYFHPLALPNRHFTGRVVKDPPGV